MACTFGQLLEDGGCGAPARIHVVIGRNVDQKVSEASYWGHSLCEDHARLILAGIVDEDFDERLRGTT